MHRDKAAHFIQSAIDAATADKDKVIEELRQHIIGLSSEVERQRKEGLLILDEHRKDRDRLQAQLEIETEFRLLAASKLTQAEKARDELVGLVREMAEALYNFLGYTTSSCHCGHPACHLCEYTKEAEQVTERHRTLLARIDGRKTE